MNSSQRMPRASAGNSPVQNLDWPRILLALAATAALASLPSLIPRQPRAATQATIPAHLP